MAGLTLAEEKDFFDAVLQGALVLCPNHRISIALRESYGSLRRKFDLSPVCHTPNIFAIDVWLTEQWHLLANKGHPLCSSLTLLNGQHELLLWQEIIRNSEAASVLLNPNATARTAIEAYSLMQQYQLPLDRLQDWLHKEWQLAEDTFDLTLFCQWLRLFEETLHEKHLITLSGLFKHSKTLLEDKQLALSEEVLLFGFSEPPPLYQDTLQAIDSTSTLRILSSSHHEPTLSRQSFSSPEHEMNAAAHWASKIISKNPKAEIVIICPELRANENTLRRLFSHQLSDQNFSLLGGTAANEAPLISSALNLLSLNQTSIHTIECCRLIRSNFIGGAEKEMSQRAALELKLRNHGEPEVSLSHIRALCHIEQAPYYCPDLGARLQALMESSRHLINEKRPCSQWIKLILEQLTILGWPHNEKGGEDITLNQQEPLRAWQQLLDDFQQASSLLQPSLYTNAIAVFSQLASSQKITQSQHYAPIQIISPGEAENLHFSHSWFMGMNEQQWPPVNDKNPFIPYALQKEYCFPDSDKHETFLWYQALVEKLIKNSSAHFHFSYSQLHDDEISKPANIVTHYVSEDSELIKESELLPTSLDPLFYQLREQEHLKVFHTMQSLPLTDNEVETVGGGVKLIENQAQCPFKAFATHRLKAKELPNPRYGLPPKQAGIMLHQALEDIWQHLASYQVLINMTEDESTGLIDRVVDTVIQHSSRHYPFLMQARFNQIESKRMKHFLAEWLDTEKSREFSHVIDQEKHVSWQHGSLHLEFKIDRIEELTSGKLGLIDYKSGKKSTIKWTDPRPDSPQLLLYLLAVEASYGKDTVSSVLLAHINVQEKLFYGLDAEAAEIDKNSIKSQLKSDDGPTWDALKDMWQNQIENMADEFSEGLHSITPKSTQSCQYCHLSALCRINDLVEQQPGSDATVSESP